MNCDKYADRCRELVTQIEGHKHQIEALEAQNAELAKKLTNHCEIMACQDASLTRLEAQNAKLRAALEEIVQHQETWKAPAYKSAKMAKMARKALA